MAKGDSYTTKIIKERCVRHYEKSKDYFGKPTDVKNAIAGFTNNVGMYSREPYTSRGVRAVRGRGLGNLL